MTIRAATSWFRTGLLALVFLTAGLTTAWAQEYRLAPGDVIRTQITGLNDSFYLPHLDMTGTIRLPYLGTYKAQGKTLDELLNENSIVTAGRQIEVSTNGINQVIVLNQSAIFLDIEQYRPITVIGAVASPGQVAFEPGLTVRSAIGISGGFLVPGLTQNQSNLPNLRIRIEEVRQNEAWLAADLWRLSALLSEADRDNPPEEYASLIRNQLTEADIESLRARIAGEFDQLARDHEDLKARIELSGAQVELLKVVLDQYKTASDTEEERLARVASLSDRGLTTVDVLERARSSALNMSTRLLTTQAELAEAERELQALQRQQLELDAAFRQGVLEEKARVDQQFAEARVRSKAIRGELALGALVEDADDTVTPAYRIVLHRRSNGAETSALSELGKTLEPGDVVEVLLGDT